MRTKTKIISLLILFLFIVWIAQSVYSYYFLPGQYDNFTKCLTEKGAVMYGAMEWCKFTQAQKGMFGKSFKYVNYKEYTEYPSEFGKIHKTPTWIIDGKPYENTQSFDRLAHLTGCKIS